METTTPYPEKRWFHPLNSTVPGTAPDDTICLTSMGLNQNNEPQAGTPSATPPYPAAGDKTWILWFKNKSRFLFDAIGDINRTIQLLHRYFDQWKPAFPAAEIAARSEGDRSLWSDFLVRLGPGNNLEDYMRRLNARINDIRNMFGPGTLKDLPWPPLGFNGEVNKLSARRNDLRWLSNKGPALSPSDLVRLPALANKLKQPAATDKVTQMVKSRLRTTTVEAISKYEGGAVPSVLAKLILDDLNTLIEQASVYDPAIFASVNLRQETQQLCQQQNLPESALRCRNRLLLEDAFPQEVSEGMDLINLAPVAGTAWDPSQPFVVENINDGGAEIPRVEVVFWQDCEWPAANAAAHQWRSYGIVTNFSLRAVSNEEDNSIPDPSSSSSSYYSTPRGGG